MKRQLFSLLIILLFYSQVYSQPHIITLESCYKAVVLNYPLGKQKDLLDKSNVYKISNIQKNWYPQLLVNGQATYQSDVTKIPISLPMVTIPTMSQDMYKLALDINQPIYDGGDISKQKKLEKINLQIDQQNVEVGLYELKERVNQVYFGIILLQESKKQLKLVREDLELNKDNIESGVKNGTMMQAQADQLNAEIIKIDQQLTDNIYTSQSYAHMLEELTGLKISESDSLALPNISVFVADTTNQRPEMKIFDLQQNKMDQMKSIINTRTMPKLSGFGELGYGRPGLNMLSNDFKDFYIVGMRLSWNIWNWNQNKNDKLIYDFQKELITNQKQIFEKNTDVAVQTELSNISKYESLISSDQQMIDLHNRILITYSSQLKNGIITTSDFINELNNKLQALLNMESHKIQLIMAKVNYLNLVGKN